MELSERRIAVLDRSHRILRVTVVVCLVLLTLIAFADPGGNSDILLPRSREAVASLLDATRLGLILYYFSEALRVLAPLYWLVAGAWAVRQKLTVRPFLEDTPFVVAAILLPYGLFGYAMAHSDSDHERHAALENRASQRVACSALGR